MGNEIWDNIRTSTTRVERPPRMTNEIIEGICDRDAAFLEALKKSDPNILAEAKRLRTDSKRVVRNA